MNIQFSENNNYIKKSNHPYNNNKNIKRNAQQGKIKNKNNFNNNDNNRFHPPSNNQNIFQQKRDNNFINILENQVNNSPASSLQAYINGNLNINTTNINQNIYNNNIYSNDDSDESSNINNNIHNQRNFNNLNLNEGINNNYINNLNFRSIHNNNKNNYIYPNSNNLNQINNYNQLINLNNSINNLNNNNNNQITNNDLELIKLKLLYLNALNNNNNFNSNINDIPNYTIGINNQNSNSPINQSILEQLRILKESNMKKEYLINLLQIQNQIEKKKKMNLINYINSLNNQNQIKNQNNNLLNLQNEESFDFNNNTINLIMNQNNPSIDQIYRQLINNQIMNQNIQQPQFQSIPNNNININENIIQNNYQRNINQPNIFKNNIDINQILETFKNNPNPILNNNTYNINNRIKFNTNNHNQNHNHISNSLNLYKMDNETIIKEAYNLIKGQMGCRFLQKKIEEETEFALEFIYPIIKLHLNEIIIDKFGNYLIQKFLEYLPQQEISFFINSIKDNFLSIGLNQYGTRVIQKLVELIKNSDDKYNNYKTLVSLITPNIIQFSNDLNGCHIIQQIFNSKTFKNDFLFEFYRDNIVKIANDKNGCCFLQKCMDKLFGEDLNRILEIIFKNIKEIIIDKYGNYVIQFIIKNKINTDEENPQNIKKFNLTEIFNFIMDDFVNYSNQKYSSNVIEKLLILDELRPQIIIKLKNLEITRSLLFEKFGNYVIQKALHFADDNDKDELLKNIGILSEELRKVDFGNKLLNKLMTKYPKLINYMKGNDKNINSNTEQKEENYFINNNNNIVHMILTNQNSYKNSNNKELGNKKINNRKENDMYKVKK